MIVDDEALARRGLALRIRQYDDIDIVGEARNGREALSGIREHHPDIVFLDIQMPGMNGFDVIRELGADELPAIVFVTHNVEEAVYMASRVVVLTRGPGRIAAEFPVEGPMPRPEHFRSTPAFRATAEAVSDALAQGVAA